MKAQTHPPKHAIMQVILFISAAACAAMAVILAVKIHYGLVLDTNIAGRAALSMGLGSLFFATMGAMEERPTVTNHDKNA